MPLKLMFITNRTDVAKIAEKAGVDRIFVDMEYIDKKLRQGGMDTVQSMHTLKDVCNIKQCLSISECLVRCNPIHDATSDYTSTETEVDGIITNGADVIMLPYFKTVYEVERFLKCVKGRVKTMLLIETPEAVQNIDEILSVGGIDEIHIGLNDLSLGYKKQFMFELLSDGTVEILCNKIRDYKIPYGFGGIASPGKGMLPAEKIIAEHYRLGSTAAILSRSFCDISKNNSLQDVANIFNFGVKSVRDCEAQCVLHPELLYSNMIDTHKIIDEIVKNIKLKIQ